MCSFLRLLTLTLIVGFASHQAGASSPSEASPLAPPTTNQGDYATGCSGGSCLLFDDHWTESSLDTNNWRPGLYVAGEYDMGCTSCNPPSTIGKVGFPISLWGASSDTNYAFYFDYDYGYSSNPLGTSFPPLTTAADGSLQFETLQNSYYKSINSYAQYVGAAITSIPTIPNTGGLVRFRAKFDANLQYGFWPGVQCSANNSQGYDYNFNMEWGYEGGKGPLWYGGLSGNNATIGHFTIPNTDATNWHTYAMEYTGDSSSPRVVNYYVDGILQGTWTPGSALPKGANYNCAFYPQVIAAKLGSGWHSVPNFSIAPGPFYMWISDIQFYKKPGT
jgi:hypothetical protein